jgi:hypothetical protein
MKIVKLIIFFIIHAGVLGCANTNRSSYTAEVNLISYETGAITVKSVGYGNNRINAIADAQKNAFQVILFRGLPNNSPIVENEGVAKVKSRDYFYRFFEQEYYKTFMMSSTESSNLISIRGGYKISVDIKVNTQALRKDLEQNQVVRKFGY